MNYIKKYTDQEIEAARYVLNHYRATFPTLEGIEDEVIVNDILRCKKILSYAETLVEEIVSEKKDDTPWFLKGPKSQNFKRQLEECLQQDAYGEIRELREEISRIKNKYAHERYIKIFNHVINKSR